MNIPVAAWLGRGAAALAALGLAVALPALCSAQAQSVSTGTVTVPAGTTHVGTIHVGAGSVVVRGTEIGDVNVGVGLVEVSGRVTGSVSVGMGQLILSHDASVAGTIHVGMGGQTRLSAGQPLPAVRRGASLDVNAPFPPLAPGHLPLWRLAGGFGSLSVPWSLGAVGLLAGLLGRLAWWLISLAVAFVLLSLFPEPTRRIADDIERAPGPSLGWGLLVALASGPAMVLLAITILGIPLSLLLVLALLAAKVMGYVAVSLLLGARVLPRLGGTKSVVGWDLAAGTVLLLLVGSIPVLGLLVDLLVAFLGIGACGRTGFGTGRPWFRNPGPPPTPAV